MKNNIKITLIVLLVPILIFTLVFIAGKKNIPDILDNKADIKAPISLIENKLLGKRAPFFDLVNVSGDRVKSDDLIGKPSIFVFWSTWNSESADQIRIIDDYLLSKNIQTSLINVLAINSMEDSSLVKSFVNRGQYSVSVVSDFVGDVSEHYNVKSLPTTYFIDRDGFVSEIYTGILSGEMIVDKVDNLLK